MMTRKQPRLICRRELREYPIPGLRQSDWTAIPAQIDTVRGAVLGLLLAKRYGFGPGIRLVHDIECMYFSIGRSQDRYDGRRRIKVAALAKNDKDFGVNYCAVSHVRQGIVHMAGPEPG